MDGGTESRAVMWIYSRTGVRIDLIEIFSSDQLLSDQLRKINV